MVEYQMLRYSTKTQKLPPRKHVREIYRNLKSSSPKTDKNIARQAIQTS